MKSQKIKAIVISTLLVGLVAISSCSRHENRYRPDNHYLTTRVERISRELDLNKDQVEQLEALISNFEEKRTAIVRGHAIVDDIGQQLAAEQFDEKYVANTISNYLDEVEAFSMDFIKNLSALHSSLTPEQKVKITHYLPANKREHYHHQWYH
jgi:Spy/CpxP family protein refolding chaperone